KERLHLPFPPRYLSPVQVGGIIFSCNHLHHSYIGSWYLPTDRSTCATRTSTCAIPPLTCAITASTCAITRVTCAITTSTRAIKTLTCAIPTSTRAIKSLTRASDDPIVYQPLLLMPQLSTCI